MTILIVGGSFDNSGGRPSGIIKKLSDAIADNEAFDAVSVFNGGFFEQLNSLLEAAGEYDSVLWAPNVPNDYPKLRDIKDRFRHIMLVTAKRNNNEYNFHQLIARSLEQKANLTIEFTKKSEKVYNMRLFDPLGNVWFDGKDAKKLASRLGYRLSDLKRFTRIPSLSTGNPFVDVPKEEEFFRFARNCSDIFHNLIQPAPGTKRFLGNMSFRCQNGFPSFRCGRNEAFVSCRNINKSEICQGSFVHVKANESGPLVYDGEAKPSVDTPVQLLLYKNFPQIKYMIHAHCYFYPLDRAPIFTAHPVPCGAIEEVHEIIQAVDAAGMTDSDFIAVNLLGHGCILMSKTVKKFTELMKNRDSCFVSRPSPENFTDFISPYPFLANEFKSCSKQFSDQLIQAIRVVTEKNESGMLMDRSVSLLNAFADSVCQKETRIICKNTLDGGHAIIMKAVTGN